MTLHEAIEKLLRQEGRPMTAREIAECLNINKWYVKGDKSRIKSSQITARVDDHHELFEIDRSTYPLTIKLYGRQVYRLNKIEQTNSVMPIQEIKTIHVSKVDSSFFDQMLMNEKNYKSALNIDHLVPPNPGLYCLRINDIKQLPKPFNTFLTERGHNIIYIGIATENLQKRFLHQEIRAKGHGTFFRSIGAVLGYFPPKGSLIEMKNKRNYKFSKTDEQKIINWINENLRVNWIEFNGDFESIETELIQKYKPLINIAKNPLAIPLLSDLRKKCVDLANEL